MEQSLVNKIFAKIGVAILAIALVDLLFINYWIVKSEKVKGEQPVTAETRTVEIRPSPEATPSPSPLPTNIPGGASPIVKTETIIQKETKTIVQNAQKEIFIPIGSGSTKSNSYDDLVGLEVAIDSDKYSDIDSVVFEASLWVEGANGRAWARLVNKTDNNPFIESQIASETGSAALKTSGSIPWPAGSKTYKVQAKTDITNFAAHVDNARIKITLR